MTQKTTLTLGHSPDPDDAFLFYGITTKKVRLGGITFEHVLQDIETLNQRALKEELDITAVSLHAYAFITQNYYLLPYGTSMGDQYGPILVARRPLTLDQLTKVKIASPGPKTTAQLVLSLCLSSPKLENVEFIPFDQILDAVSQGRVEAGMLIHEGQLTFGQKGLCKVLDLGSWWNEKTGLPLPLGVNVIHRRLGNETIQQFAKILRRSIQYAMEHRSDALQYAMHFARDLEIRLTDRFVSMYVNDYAQDLGTKGLQAIERLFTEAKTMGLIPPEAAISFIEEEKREITQ